MSKEDCMFSKDHEWIMEEGGCVLIGISDFAQASLGDIVYVELPKPGAVITAGKAFGSVESVKAVSDLLAPVSGKIIEVNEELDGAPELLNTEPFSAWIVKIEPSAAFAAEKAGLMPPAEYEEFCHKEG